VALLALPALALAQSAPTLEQIVSRLERLERENAQLRSEVAQLRSQVATLHSPPFPGTVPGTGSAPIATVEERLDVAERRIEEQSAIKLEASQRFPIRLNGMLIANLFRNGPHAGGFDTPTVASATAGRRTAGLSFRQSIIGFDYLGGQSLLGARVRGNISMDFYEGLAESGSGYSPIRLRTASFGLDWSSTSLSFGLDKPIFSPRDPNSFSYYIRWASSGDGPACRDASSMRIALMTTAALRSRPRFTSAPRT
jgi:hypothetical protein